MLGAEPRKGAVEQVSPQHPLHSLASSAQLRCLPHQPPSAHLLLPLLLLPPHRRASPVQALQQQRHQTGCHTGGHQAVAPAVGGGQRSLQSFQRQDCRAGRDGAASKMGQICKNPRCSSSPLASHSSSLQRQPTGPLLALRIPGRPHLPRRCPSARRPAAAAPQAACSGPALPLQPGRRRAGAAGAAASR